MFTKAIVLSAVSLAATAIPTPVIAQTVVRESRTVIIDRADLLSAEGRARIDARLIHAANRVCEPAYRRGVLFTRGADACRDAALADARRQLDQRVAAATGTIQIAVVNGANASR